MCTCLYARVPTRCFPHLGQAHPVPQKGAPVCERCPGLLYWLNLQLTHGPSCLSQTARTNLDAADAADAPHAAHPRTLFYSQCGTQEPKKKTTLFAIGQSSSEVRMRLQNPMIRFLIWHLHLFIMPAILVQQNCSRPKLSACVAQLLELAVFAYDVSQN